MGNLSEDAQSTIEAIDDKKEELKTEIEEIQNVSSDDSDKRWEKLDKIYEKLNQLDREKEAEILADKIATRFAELMKQGPEETEETIDDTPQIVDTVVTEEQKEEKKNAKPKRRHRFGR